MEGARDLVQVVAGAPELTECLLQCNMVDGRAALGAGSGIAKANGAHEAGDGEAGLTGLGSNGVEFLVQAAEGNYLAAPPLVTARHCRPLSRWRAPRCPARSRGGAGLWSVQQTGWSRSRRDTPGR